MLSLRWAIVASLLFVGCSKGPPDPKTSQPAPSTVPMTPAATPANPVTTPTPGPVPTPMIPPADGKLPADNTGINERDKNDTTQTPVDQSEQQDDLNVTAAIRQRVVAAEGFSVNARNVKIITENGTITLRGPVATKAEKDQIVSMANTEAGTKYKVVDQLEVAP